MVGISRARARIRTVVALVLAAAGFLLTACSAPHSALSIPADEQTDLLQELHAISRAEQAAILRRMPAYRDPVLERRLEAVLEQILAPLGMSSGGFRFVVLSDAVPDAYSFPDGSIFLHTGLLACLENEAQLALLLAHEAVHVIREHALQYHRLAAAGACGPMSENLECFQGLASRWSAVLTSHRLMRLRQSLEEEADRMGLDLIIGADYDPHEALTIFNDVRDPAAGHSGDRLMHLRAVLTETPRPAPRTGTAADGFRSDLRSLLMHQARSDAQTGRWESALNFARRYVRDFPDNAQGHFLLGEILRQRHSPGDAQQALSHYRRALHFNPRCPRAHKALGMVHLKEGRLDRARAYFQKALALSPETADEAYLVHYVASLPVGDIGDTQ
jgi:beta-barrel assembly-enhancing protease